jgi:hypothetical protein
MATKREMEDMQTVMAAELDGFSATLASFQEQQQNLAGYLATLLRLLADAGVVSRVTGPFSALFQPPQPCLFCGEIH